MSHLETIKKLAAEGKSTKIIRATLTLAEVEDKEISRLMSEAGVGRTRGGFTQQNTLALIEGGVTEYDLYQKLIDEKARNELRWINDRNKIRVTMNRVHEKYGKPVNEKPATEAQKKKAAAIVKG